MPCKTRYFVHVLVLEKQQKAIAHDERSQQKLILENLILENVDGILVLVELVIARDF